MNNVCIYCSLLRYYIYKMTKYTYYALSKTTLVNVLFLIVLTIWPTV